MRLRLRQKLSLRLERRRLQLRALWKARELSVVSDRTADMPPGPVLFATVRNEAPRLEFFLDYYRKLGVVHFMFVDNGSADETQALLRHEPDVSLWETDQSYNGSRFGVDWINALLARYGVGRWVLVVDADEFLVYPHHETRRLPALTRWLESRGQDGLATILLDMYGDAPIADTRCPPGSDPIVAAPWFDAVNYVQQRHNRYHNLWIQGGPRMRVFYADRPRFAPALNKIPLVRWRSGYVYLTSTHNLLPRRLNRVYEVRGGSTTTGALLHAKFLDVLPAKVIEELGRREHYDNGSEYAAYAALGAKTQLWTRESTRFEGWRQLCDLGLMAEGGWF